MSSPERPSARAGDLLRPPLRDPGDDTPGELAVAALAPPSPEQLRVLGAVRGALADNAALIRPLLLGDSDASARIVHETVARLPALAEPGGDVPFDTIMWFLDREIAELRATEPLGDRSSSGFVDR